MKHLFLSTSLALGLCLGALPVTAQTPATSVGVLIGPSMIWLRGDYYLQDLYEPDYGFGAGLFAQRRLTDRFGFRLEALYERKGALVDFGTAYPVSTPGGSGATRTEPYRDHRRFNYLTIPLLLRFATGAPEKYFLQAGPYVGVLLCQRDVVRLQGKTTKDDFTSSYKGLDAGLTVAVGSVVRRWDRVHVTIEARGSWGLVDIADFDNATSAMVGQQVRTTSVGLLLGVAFDPAAQTK